MQYSIHTIQSENDWKKYAKSFAPNAFFQSWSWGDSQKRIGITVYRFGLFLGAQCVGIAQTFLIKAKRGTFYHVRHGPMVKDASRQLMNIFLQRLVPYARKDHALFMRISPLVTSKAGYEDFFHTSGLRPAPIHAMDAEHCWVLDITKSDEELLAGMRKTIRYEIRHADKFGITVRVSTSASDLSDFFRLYDKTSKRQNFVQHTGIREEFETFGKDGNSILLLGYSNKELQSAAIIIFQESQAIYRHGASLPGKAPVSTYVQWQAISEAKKRGIKLYNFWGIAPDENQNHPWWGISLFKKGFGGYPVSYIHAHDLPLSPLYIIPKTIESIRKIIKKY